MEQVFEYVAKYHCAKCQHQWFLRNRIRNRPSLCESCGMPTYPNTEDICSFFHIPRYRSISRLLTIKTNPSWKLFRNIGLRGKENVVFDWYKWWIFNETFFVYVVSFFVQIFLKNDVTPCWIYTQMSCFLINDEITINRPFLERPPISSLNKFKEI